MDYDNVDILDKASSVKKLFQNSIDFYNTSLKTALLYIFF